VLSTAFTRECILTALIMALEFGLTKQMACNFQVNTRMENAMVKVSI
jgi:hypothetical protein